MELIASLHARKNRSIYLGQKQQTDRYTTIDYKDRLQCYFPKDFYIFIFIAQFNTFVFIRIHRYTRKSNRLVESTQTVCAGGFRGVNIGYEGGELQANIKTSKTSWCKNSQAVRGSYTIGELACVRCPKS